MKNTITKVFAAVAASALFFGTVLSSAGAYNGWADEYINFCNARGIITGNENGDLMPEEKLTREQMAKMLLTAFSIDTASAGKIGYFDVAADRWSYKYISKYSEYAFVQKDLFRPDENVTREEFFAMAVKIAGYGNMTPLRKDAFDLEFEDYTEINPTYYDLIVVGFEKKFIQGSDNLIKPKDFLTRAEACTLLYKLVNGVENDKLASDNDSLQEQEDAAAQNPDSEQSEEQELIMSSTPLMGESEATVEQAKQWATNRGAHQRFIDIADLYWKYGEITGIRADVLYAQAAKETNFGKYTGQVQPEQNNWAGIKKYGAVGDEPDDHECFETPEDGVRGHFNHMSAYVGAEPVGEPHGRYRSVKSLSWAGTVKTVEELGGKWCPNPTYGLSIVDDYLIPMINTKVNE